MTRLCLLIAFVTSCASIPPETPSRLVDDLNFSFESCMPGVHTLRDKDFIPTLRFINDLAHIPFSCEYFEGKPIRLYGSFGPKLKIKGREVHAGYGYVLADRTRSVAEELVPSHLSSYFNNLEGRTPLRIFEKGIGIPGYHRGVQSFFVEVAHPILGARIIAVLSVVDFPVDDPKHRLFLWVQDTPLSEERVVARFRVLLPLIVPPYGNIAYLP